MAELTPEEKSFVVQHLARHHTLSEVREMLLEEYEKDTTTAQLARYNPDCKAGATLSPELKAEFAAARKAFDEDKETSPIFRKHFRGRELLSLYRTAKSKKNYGLAAQLLMQGAKEEGGQFTNKSLVEQTNNLPAPAVYDMSKLSREELDTVEKILAKAAFTNGDTGGTGKT